MRGWVLMSLIAAGLCAPAQQAAAQATNSLEDVRDQGVLYFKKGIYKQAKNRLDRAYAMRPGKKDFLTAYYRGQTHYKLLLLEPAFEMATLAKTLAEGDEKRLRKVEQFVAEMRGLYGAITFKAAKGETNERGRIFFEAKTGIINRDKKQRFLSIRERFRSTDIRLPTTVYLPYGEYLANKVPFAIAPEDKEPPVKEIFLQVVVETTEEGINPWWWIGGGVVAASAVGVAAFFLLGDETAAAPADNIFFDIQPLHGRP